MLSVKLQNKNAANNNISQLRVDHAQPSLIQSPSQEQTVSPYNEKSLQTIQELRKDALSCCATHQRN